MSGFEYLEMTLTSGETMLIEDLLHACLTGRTNPKNCFESLDIEENLLLRKQCAFKNDSNNLLTVYTRNWRFRLNTVRTAVI